MIITAGKYKGRKIIAPDEKITRPTLSKVRQGVFNTLYSIMGEFDNKTFFDVFAGSGIMGLEALSRNFSEVYAIEKNYKIAQILKKNYNSLGLEPNIKIGDSLQVLKNKDRVFDVVYIDPPYFSGIYENVLELIPNVIHKKSVVIVEHSAPLIIENLMLIKTKNYGGKLVSFFAGFGS